MEKNEELRSTSEQSVEAEPLMPMDDIRKIAKIDFNLNSTDKAAPAPDKNFEVEKSVTTKLMTEAHKQAIIATIQNKEEVKNGILEQAERSISNELAAMNQENQQRIQEATYNANKEACANYGINSDVPVWQVRLMRIGSAFWFLMYWLVASITICPINVFCRGLRAFIKQGWVVILVGVLLYLLVVVGIPLITTLIANIK